MIVTMWCEEYDGERLALWIKVLRRDQQQGPAVQVEKYSRQVPVPGTGISIQGQFLVMAAELQSLVSDLDTGEVVRKYIGRHDGWADEVLAASPVKRPVRRSRASTARLLAAEMSGQQTLPGSAPAAPKE